MHLIGLRLPDWTSISLLYFAAGREDDILQELFRPQVQQDPTRANLPDKWRRVHPHAHDIFRTSILEAGIGDSKYHDYQAHRPSTISYMLQLPPTMRNQIKRNIQQLYKTLKDIHDPNWHHKEIRRPAKYYHNDVHMHTHPRLLQAQDETLRALTGAGQPLDRTQRRRTEWRTNEDYIIFTSPPIPFNIPRRCHHPKSCRRLGSNEY